MPAPPLTPLAAAVLHVGEPERVLVLECGDGDAVLLLAREFPRAGVRGVDSSPDAVRAAAARVGLDPEGRVAFKAGHPRALPFPDEHFDLIAAVDARPAPREVARVLRPGGFLALARTGPGRPCGPLLARRLARRGFEPARHGSAGAGAFAVLRLGERGDRLRRG